MDSATGSHSPVVLVVDDHEDTRQMSLIVLRTQGFEPVVAEGAIDAFERACHHQPDVI